MHPRTGEQTRRSPQGRWRPSPGAAGSGRRRRRARDRTGSAARRAGSRGRPSRWIRSAPSPTRPGRGTSRGRRTPTASARPSSRRYERSRRSARMAISPDARDAADVDVAGDRVHGELQVGVAALVGCVGTESSRCGRRRWMEDTSIQTPMPSRTPTCTSPEIARTLTEPAPTSRSSMSPDPTVMVVVPSSRRISMSPEALTDQSRRRRPSRSSRSPDAPLNERWPPTRRPHIAAGTGDLHVADDLVEPTSPGAGTKGERSERAAHLELGRADRAVDRSCRWAPTMSDVEPRPNEKPHVSLRRGDRSSRGSRRRARHRTSPAAASPCRSPRSRSGRLGVGRARGTMSFAVTWMPTVTGPGVS